MENAKLNRTANILLQDPRLQARLKGLGLSRDISKFKIEDLQKALSGSTQFQATDSDLKKLVDGLKERDPNKKAYARLGASYLLWMNLTVGGEPTEACASIVKVSEALGKEFPDTQINDRQFLGSITTGQSVEGFRQLFPFFGGPLDNVETSQLIFSGLKFSGTCQKSVTSVEGIIQRNWDGFFQKLLVCVGNPDQCREKKVASGK